ncbi:hypothetical protein CVT26_003096 [Gymnopilus dilepis]|uniref:MYND-type domain-containing protein n=1 Tax=Gymnopilus dilepis TaxID=231916 RepID=A0A409Y4S6_9AGAR|nr:hypothetical protein CVT26_003096 [Gymnopilus dilepis]
MTVLKGKCEGCSMAKILLRCKGCLMAAYCSEECQRRMRPRHSSNCRMPKNPTPTDIEVRKALGDFFTRSKSLLGLLACRLHLRAVDEAGGPVNKEALLVFLQWRTSVEIGNDQTLKRRDFLSLRECYLVNEHEMWSEAEVNKRGLPSSSIWNGPLRIFIRVEYEEKGGELKELPVVRDYDLPLGLRAHHIPPMPVLFQRIRAHLPSTGTKVMPAELVIRS